MSKYQKPIRGIKSEIYDVDLTPEKYEELQQAYTDFWLTLEPELALALNLMLL